MCLSLFISTFGLKFNRRYYNALHHFDEQMTLWTLGVSIFKIDHGDFTSNHGDYHVMCSWRLFFIKRHQKINAQKLKTGTYVSKHHSQLPSFCSTTFGFFLGGCQPLLKSFGVPSPRGMWKGLFLCQQFRSIMSHLLLEGYPKHVARC